VVRYCVLSSPTGNMRGLYLVFREPGCAAIIAEVHGKSTGLPEARAKGGADWQRCRQKQQIPK